MFFRLMDEVAREGKRNRAQVRVVFIGHRNGHAAGPEIGSVSSSST
jgi:hypothetical protein